MPLARLYNFAPATVISDAEVDDEFNQIVELLAGTKLDTVILKSSSASDATLTVDNTGGGKVVEWRVGGTAKARVNATGQLESVLATGTAPFVVASTTVVTNLNADSVDGKHLADLLLDIDPSVAVNGGGNSQLDLERAAGKIRLTNNATGLVVTNVDSAVTLLTIDKGASKAVTVYGVLKGVTPVSSEDLTRKDYVDALATSTQTAAALAANLVTGLSGGTDNRVVRWSSGSAWTDASASDGVQLLESLLFKNNGNYYKPGSVVPTSGLTQGTNYFLSTSAGVLTATSPTPGGGGGIHSSVYIGRALSSTALLFNPGRPIGP